MRALGRSPRGHRAADGQRLGAGGAGGRVWASAKKPPWVLRRPVGSLLFKGATWLARALKAAGVGLLLPRGGWGPGRWPGCHRRCILQIAG